MRKTFVVTLCVLFALSLLVAGAMAKNAPGKYAQYKFVDTPTEPTNSPEIGGSMFQAAAATTTVLAWFQFDTAGGAPTKQGWTEHDVSSQLATYFHVDGNAPQGTSAMLPLCNNITPINGQKSMWCGQWITTADPWCGWTDLPGYGNSWDQSLITNVGLTVNSVTYTIMWDSEPGYDFTYVEWWDPVNLIWVKDPLVNGATGEYTSGPANGDPGGPATETSTSTFGATKMRFHFTADGAWSDEDGLWDTVGAVMLDDLAMNGGPVEDFEGETCRATQSTDAKWVAAITPAYGLYSGLVSGAAIVQEDPCGKPLSNMWEFFDNPAVTNYACGGWPLQGAMPYGPDGNGLYMTNEVHSPWIPIAGAGTSFLLQFLTYRDLPLDNLQFYVWSARTRNTGTGGCPTTWRDNNFVYYGDNKDWLRQQIEIGPFMNAADTDVQIALGAVDMCGVWCGINGTGACHSHAPLIDQCRVVRVGVVGPQWTIRDIDTWNDNFPEEGGIDATSFARCDEAMDILLSTNPNILPGDSMKVVVTDPAGLAVDATGGRSRRAVYVFVKVTDRFGASRPYTPLQIQSPEIKAYSGGAGDVTGFIRFPYVAAVSPPGWNAYRFDYAVTNSGGRVKDGFCVDLMDLGSGATGPHYKHVNENVPANVGLFVPGDVIHYIFAAKNLANQWSYMYRTLNGQGGYVRTSALAEALNSPNEWSVLPDAGRLAGDLGDILFVDDADDRGGPAQLYFDWAFAYLGLTNRVDRFDILGPSSGVGNHLEGRVKNIQNQMIGDPVEIYQKVIWNSSDLSTSLMSDGSPAAGGTSTDKDDDFGLCFQFLDQHPDNPGWAYWGDNVVVDWANLTGLGAVNVRSIYMNHVLVNSDQRVITGIISPKVFPVALSPWVPETFWAFGGCALINRFDAVDKTGTLAARSHLYNNSAAAPAAVYQATPNANGSTARFHLAGFAYNFIRDDDAIPPMDRVNYLKYTLQYFQNILGNPIGIDPVAFANTLEDNYPNPFNPTTTIKYSIAERGMVTLKIYNAAGQLVRTLINEEQSPQAAVFSKVWNGLNDHGQSVASGVYFYQLTAKNFDQTKKMVLLK